MTIQHMKREKNDLSANVWAINSLRGVANQPPRRNPTVNTVVPDGIQLEANRLLPLGLTRHDERPCDIPVK